MSTKYSMSEMEKQSKQSKPMYGNKFLSEMTTDDLTEEELQCEKIIDDAMAIVHSKFDFKKLDDIPKALKSKYNRTIGHCIHEYCKNHDSEFLASKILESIEEITKS